MRAPAFWNIKNGRDAAFVVRTLLLPLSWLYNYVTQKKIANASPVKLGAKVISIGNLTLGGTGKTPFADMLANQLDAAYIVSRGYGGKIKVPTLVNPEIHTAEDVGDEPLMLAQNHNVIIGRDRLAAAQIAVDLGAKYIILDDAHQNPAIHKDLSIVLIDGGVGFGNGFICPSGPLREKPTIGLGRADLVVWVGNRDLYQETMGNYKVETVFANIVPTATDILDKNKKYIAFCGIGRPEKFGESLHDAGYNIIDLIPFGDHHFYTDAEISMLKERAASEGAGLITTTKDLIRLNKSQQQTIETLKIEVTFADGQDKDKFMSLLTAL